MQLKSFHERHLSWAVNNKLAISPIAIRLPIMTFQARVNQMPVMMSMGEGVPKQVLVIILFCRSHSGVHSRVQKQIGQK